MIRSVGAAGPVKVMGLMAWMLRYDLLAMLIVAAVTVPLGDVVPAQALAPMLPLLGVAVSIFIGFRNSSAYGRWWEARNLWGTLSANCTALKNALTALENSPGQMARAIDEMLRRQVRHAWQLAAELRRVPALPGVTDLTPEDARDATAASLLARQAESVRNVMLAGLIDGQGRAILTNLNTAQSAAAAGLERIRNQPLPPPYTGFVRSLAWIFGVLVCLRLGSGAHDRLSGIIFGLLVTALFVLAERLGHFLENPMSNTAVDLPLYRFCNRITINLLGSGHPLAQPQESAKATVWMWCRRG